MCKASFSIHEVTYTVLHMPFLVRPGCFVGVDFQFFRKYATYRIIIANHVVSVGIQIMRGITIRNLP